MLKVPRALVREKNLEIQATFTIKALLGMLARLSWGKRNMIGSMDGRQGRVYLEYAKELTNKFAR